ncbi:MAG: hypothetical protein ACLTKG_02630 [Collinsella intestinalis]
MVKRSASRRHEALDSFGVQLNENYASCWPLTSARSNSATTCFATATPRFARGVGRVARHDRRQLLLHRTALLERIREHFIEVYRSIARTRSPTSTMCRALGSWPAAARRSQLSSWTRSLSAVRTSSAAAARSMGPHRDEVLFTIDSRSARDFGSRGQTLDRARVEDRRSQVTRDILGGIRSCCSTT